MVPFPRWVALAALLLAGCAAARMAGLAPGRSTEADVRAALGEPARTFRAADGSRELVFPTGPAGTETFVAIVSPDGRLTSLEQVLKEDSFQRIVTGKTTGDEVERLIGPPWRTIAFPNLGQVAWDYCFQDTWGYPAEFSVMIDGRGIVADKITKRKEGRTGNLP
jgi:hypothetical protein